MTQSFPHIQNANDLVTTSSETRAGFVAIALEKNRRAIPCVEEGRALKSAVKKTREPADLLNIKSIQPALLTASGLSEKAKRHLRASDKKKAIKSLIEKYLEPAGSGFIDELIYRFLIVRGDSLGGTMRNLAGFLAEQSFKRSLVSALSLRQKRFYWHSKKSGHWLEGGVLNDDIEDIIGIGWKNRQPRSMMFNKTIKRIGKNIDICLLRSPHESLTGALSEPENYLLFGELKGGIDPAGADEHWKTARTAIERIINGFQREQQPIKTLFLGAAIEKAMAQEIWDWLQDGKLSNAGNLTNKEHTAAICNWLVEI